MDYGTFFALLLLSAGLGRGPLMADRSFVWKRNGSLQSAIISVFSDGYLVL
jgi:hypothetical protein